MLQRVSNTCACTACKAGLQEDMSRIAKDVVIGTYFTKQVFHCFPMFYSQKEHYAHYVMAGQGMFGDRNLQLVLKSQAAFREPPRHWHRTASCRNRRGRRHRSEAPAAGSCCTKYLVSTPLVLSNHRKSNSGLCEFDTHQRST